MGATRTERDRVPRARLRPEDRRAQLIELGVRMLSTHTLEELSVDRIAQEAGVSRGLLFHYFASKHDFRLEVVKAQAARLLEVTEPDPSLGPIARLNQSLAAFVDHVTATRASYLSLVRGAASGDAELREVFDRTRQAMAERVLVRMQQRGVPRTPRLVMAVRGWVAYVEEVCVLWLSEQDSGLSRADVLDLSRSALLRLAGNETPAALRLGEPDTRLAEKRS